jgi:hypothetical protein
VLGSGVGIALDGDALAVTVVKVRPSGADVVDQLRIEGYRTRAANEWGLEYGRFLRKLGLAHLAAVVLLPRTEVTVRVLSLPGVAAKDLGAAVGFQIEALHPYGDHEVVWSHARLQRTGAVMVAICEREKVDALATLLAEAGVKVAGFTVAAAAVYAASRLLEVPAAGVLAYDPRPGEVEFYGESDARPLFSALFEEADLRTVDRALGELRLGSDTPLLPWMEILPVPKSKPDVLDPSGYATALSAAVLGRALELNLLPEELRSSSSRTLYLPTLILGALTLALGAGLWWQDRAEKQKYLDLILAETKRHEPMATRLAKVNQEITRTADQIKLLDNYRAQSKKDLDALLEMTRLLAPPSFAASVNMNPQEVQVTGQAPSAPGLLQVFDGSAYFEGSEFPVAPSRTGEGEAFSLRTKREAGK